MPNVSPLSDATQLDMERLRQLREALLALLPPLDYVMTALDIDTEETHDARPSITIRLQCLQVTPIKQDWRPTTPYYESKK